MLLVAPLGIGEAQQDVALLPRPARRETLIHRSLGALLHEVARPAATVGGRGFGGERSGHV